MTKTSYTGRLRFVLVGPNAGKTMHIGMHSFRNGVVTLPPMAGEKAEVVVRAMKRFGAYLEGSPQFLHAIELYRALSKGEQPPPEPEPLKFPTKAQGEEPAFEPFKNERLIAAIKSLDPDVDRLWTKEGLPQLAAVEAAYRQGGLNRRMVTEALPGWNRSKSLKTKYPEEWITNMPIYRKKLEEKEDERQTLALTALKIGG